MQAFYLRLEGVNLGHILEDTQDLSTIRGSSLMLLDVIEAIHTRLHDFVAAGQMSALASVTSGASIGLWRFKATEVKVAEAVRDKLAGWLLDGSVMGITKHATFVVDVVEETAGGYPEARERLMAQNRWRQMQERSVVYPTGEGVATAPDSVCELDLKRPAMLANDRKPDRKRIKGDTKAVSRSVWERRVYGVEKKQTFYTRELGKGLNGGGRPTIALPVPPEFPPDHDRPFALHFASISEARKQDLKRNLWDKIAVFYADGNKFSSIQNELIGEDSAHNLGPTPLARQQALDQKMKEFRRDFLWRLLWTLAKGDGVGPPSPDEAGERDALRIASERVVRLETLLWGGDELMLVMPARLGSRVAQLFFETCRGTRNSITTVDGNLSRSPSPWKLGETQLQHGAALVFCHHDAAISSIRKLAQADLAEAAKHDRTRSLLTPLVLESFDHVGADFARYWQKRCPRGLHPKDLILPAEALGPLETLARRLAHATEGLPRRRLRGLAQALHTGGLDGEDYRARLADALSEFGLLVDGAEMGGCLAALAANGSQANARRAATFVLLEELWDYLTIGVVTGGGGP